MPSPQGAVAAPVVIVLCISASRSTPLQSPRGSQRPNPFHNDQKKSLNPKPTKRRCAQVASSLSSLDGECPIARMFGALKTKDYAKKLSSSLKGTRLLVTTPGRASKSPTPSYTSFKYEGHTIIYIYIYIYIYITLYIMHESYVL
jgi:hypothetical protein